MYEPRSAPLLPPAAFARRVGRHVVLGVAVVACALAVGTVGYHAFAGFAWIDAFLNAAMLLGGMGPVGDIPTTGGKLFAAGYALFAGLVFIGVTGILLAPLLHRVMHRFHMADDGDDA